MKIRLIYWQTCAQISNNLEGAGTQSGEDYPRSELAETGVLSVIIIMPSGRSHFNKVNKDRIIDSMTPGNNKTQLRIPQYNKLSSKTDE